MRDHTPWRSPSWMGECPRLFRARAYEWVEETESGDGGWDGGEEGESCAEVLQDLRALQTASVWACSILSGRIGVDSELAHHCRTCKTCVVGFSLSRRI
jgi:hypothetical protein